MDPPDHHEQAVGVDPGDHVAGAKVVGHPPGDHLNHLLARQTPHLPGHGREFGELARDDRDLAARAGFRGQHPGHLSEHLLTSADPPVRVGSTDRRAEGPHVAELQGPPVGTWHRQHGHPASTAPRVPQTQPVGAGRTVGQSGVEQAAVVGHEGIS